MKIVGMGAVCLALSMIAPGAAADAPKAQAEAPSMRAGFDAATGRFRPLTEAEQQELAAQGLDRSNVLSLVRAQQAKAGRDAKSAATQYGVSMDVPDEFLVQMKATVGADGRLTVGHNDAHLDTPARTEAPHE